MHWYITVLQKYTDFSGRARRMEYWMFTLINTIIYFVLMLIDSTLGFTAGSSMFGILTMLYALGVLIPGLAVTVRRLHDIGRSGWWIFISLVPVVGGIVLLVFMFMDSEPGSNAYGPSPKYAESAEFA